MLPKQFWGKILSFTPWKRKKNTVNRRQERKLLLVIDKKLNPLRAKWSMEPALISGSCSVKWMRVFDFPRTGH